jgi:homoserine kinase type II
VTFLDGVSAARPSAQQCFAGGAALADLHLAAQAYGPARANDLGPEGWQRLFDSCGVRAGEALPVEEAALGRILAEVTAAWPSDLPRGIGHLDLFPDNVLFTGAQVSGVIDFYFAAEDMWAYDLAVTVISWCFGEDGTLDTVALRRLIEGYESKRPLQAGERGALALLAQGAALRFLLTRLYDWLNVPEGALVAPKNPLEYWRKLCTLRGGEAGRLLASL